MRRGGESGCLDGMGWEDFGFKIFSGGEGTGEIGGGTWE